MTGNHAKRVSVIMTKSQPCVSQQQVPWWLNPLKNLSTRVSNGNIGVFIPVRLNSQLTIQWIGLWNKMCVAVTSHDGVSNHWQLNYLFNSLVRLAVKKIQRTALLALCAGPSQRASTAEGVSIYWCFHEWLPGMAMIVTALLTAVRVLSAGWDDSIVIRAFQVSFVVCLVKSFLFLSVPTGSEEVSLPVESTSQGVRHNFLIEPWNEAGRIIVLRCRVGTLMF